MNNEEFPEVPLDEMMSQNIENFSGTKEVNFGDTVNASGDVQAGIVKNL